MDFIMSSRHIHLYQLHTNVNIINLIEYNKKQRTQIML